MSPGEMVPLPPRPHIICESYPEPQPYRLDMTTLMLSPWPYDPNPVALVLQPQPEALCHDRETRALGYCFIIPLPSSHAHLTPVPSSHPVSVACAMYCACTSTPWHESSCPGTLAGHVTWHYHEFPSHRTERAMDASSLACRRALVQ